LPAPPPGGLAKHLCLLFFNAFGFRGRAYVFFFLVFKQEAEVKFDPSRGCAESNSIGW